MAFTGVDALTASERRVAQMAVEGLSNRDTVQALFVTLGTVEAHLTRAYQKLNIRSRQQLASALSALAPASQKTKAPGAQ
jgi:DNA-binding CsgD family transcriptional regulator